MPQQAAWIYAPAHSCNMANYSVLALAPRCISLRITNGFSPTLRRHEHLAQIWGISTHCQVSCARQGLHPTIESELFTGGKKALRLWSFWMRNSVQGFLTESWGEIELRKAVLVDNAHVGREDSEPIHTLQSSHHVLPELGWQMHTGNPMLRT